MNLLHIIASPRGDNSRTLSITNEYIQSLHTTHKDLNIDVLDLFKIQLPDVYENETNAKYTTMWGGTPDQREVSKWEEITNYSKSFLSYDGYIITCPMWNFTVPYKLKHYIDVIIQAGIMFQFTEQGVAPLNLNKKMVCFTSRGSDYSPGGPLQQYDFQEPYLRSIFGFTGIYDITFVNAEAMDYTPEITAFNLGKAKGQAVELGQQ